MNNNKQIIKKTALIILIVGLFIISSYNPQEKAGVFKFGPLEKLGTYVTMQIHARDEASAIVACDSAIYAIDKASKIMNSYDPMSEMSVAVEKAKTGPTEISDTLYYILSRSLAYSELTSDAFDPTIPALIKLWKEAEKNNKLPSSEQVEEIKNNYTGYKHIKLTKPENGKPGTLYIDSDKIALNINAIAKGYIVDLAANEIRRMPNITAAMVNIGGEIVCFNVDRVYDPVDYSPVPIQPVDQYSEPYPDDYPVEDYVPEQYPTDYYNQPGQRAPRLEEVKFRIGIKDPFIAETPGGKEYSWEIILSNSAVATSGNYQQYVTIDNVNYSHIIDPRTGYPASHNPSVTVIAPTCLAADALATALSVMSPEEGIELIDSIADTEAMIISGTKEDYRIYRSAGFSAYLE